MICEDDCIIEIAFLLYAISQPDQTGFEPTPHHITGAKLLAQSNVNKLMNHKTSNTGMGESRISVRLRNGNAKAI